MDSMWLEVILNVKAEEMDALCATLIANGVPGLAVEEEEEFRAFLEENRQYWDYVDEGLAARMKGASRVKFYVPDDELMEQMKGVSRVKFYVTDDADGKKQLAGYLQDVDLPYTTVPLREYDWAHSWQKYYRPLAVGEKLYIVPEWERDTAEIPADVTRLLMNPGLTFGTMPPRSFAWRAWKPTRSPMTWCWTWAAAAGSWPLPPCAWGRGSPPAWTLTPRPWT